MLEDRTDIRKTVFKLFKGDKWRFDFRENGYVILSTVSASGKNKDVLKWVSQFHGIDLDSCLKYLASSYRMVNAVIYEDMEPIK